MTGRNPNEFITGFQQGTFRSVREMYSLHYTELCFFSWQLIQDKQEVTDIVLDTFIKLMQRRDRFDSLSNIKAFLYITTRNACLNFLKYGKSGAVAEHNNPFTGAETAISEDVPAADITRLITTEIDSLPAPARDIFRRLYCNGEYITDIANQLSIHPRTVLEYKTQALHLLRKALTQKSAYPSLLLIYFLAIVYPQNRLATAS